MPWIRWFRDVTLDDVASVGGKNASLGEMLRELAPLGMRSPTVSRSRPMHVVR